MKPVSLASLKALMAKGGGYGLPLIGLLVLAGCAGLPDDKPLRAIKAETEYASTQMLTPTNKATWPRDDWWQAWGDAGLNEMMKEALVEQPNLQQAAARLAKARANAEQAGASMTPYSAVNASVAKGLQSKEYLTPAAFVPEGWQTYPTANLTLSWDLDLWGKNKLALAAATSAAEAAAADYAQARIEISASLATAWAEWARLWTLYDTAISAQKVRTKTLALMTNRAKQGLETEITVKRSEARLASADLDRKTLEEAIDHHRLVLAALLGAGPDRGLSLARPKLKLEKAPGLPPQIGLGLLGRRPDVVAARLRVEAAEKSIGSAKAAFYPDVNLVGLIGLQTLGMENFISRDAKYGNIGPAISLPIFDGHRLKGVLHGAEADYEQAVTHYNDTLAQALREVADAGIGLKALSGRLNAAQAVNDAAEDSWQRLNQRYEGGLATALDVLTSEDEMLASRRPLDELRTRIYVLDASLAKALGGGWQSDYAQSPAPTVASASH